MKLFNIFLVSVLFLFLTVSVFANGNNGDNEHEFKAGLMKDIFDKIENIGGAKPLITESDLVGTWVCNAITTDSVPSNKDIVWVPKGEGAEGRAFYYQYSDGIMNFIDNGDGSFSITLPSQDPCFLPTTDNTYTSPYKIECNTLYRVCYYFAWGRLQENNVRFSIERLSANRIILKSLENSWYAAKVIVLDRVITP